MAVTITHAADQLPVSTFNEALPKVYKELVGDLSEYKSIEIQKYALLFSAGGYFNILSYSLV